MTEENNQVPAGEGPEFSILRVYLKDVSFETPNSPAIFTMDVRPEINIQLNTSVNELEENLYETVLSITVTATHQEKTAFLAEVHQAGIFMLKGFDSEQKGNMLGAYCPNTLFPYAREAISELVTKGGFHPLLLSPINFDVLHAEKVAQAAAQAETAG
ncbi:MAG TPA: protein-export chaperone SecB [Gammaproteobacteria bacterium]|nr:protein-export chaperone SecB [Gammaproteobacteria bacterium]